MSKPIVTSVKRPRIPTPAEVEAAGAWEHVGRSTLVFDFSAVVAAKPTRTDLVDVEGGGLKEAIQRWLAEQL